jgi:hypothetical protein
MPSITSRWSDLMLATYEAPEELIRPHLPHPALELDRWQGRTHVTLVALHFGAVHIGGVRMPGVGDFAQVNLRLPARLGDETGVVFIRELVPNPFVASFARLLFRQPYATLPITHITTARENAITVEYLLDSPPRGCIIVTGTEQAATPPPDSFDFYCTHRLVGFGTLPGSGHRLARFPVEHPVWLAREVQRAELQLDFAAFFGAEWGFLNELKPASLVLAVGSEVQLHTPDAVTA